jgi:homoserine dehydrogenase
MSEPVSIGIAGLGTVGGGLVQLLSAHKARIAELLGRPIRIAAVSALAKAEMDRFDLSEAKFFDSAVALAQDPSISVFVELIGGADGIAKECVEAALNAKKHVVTANKALLAKHGFALAKLAEQNGVALNFEAAVAGGIPVIKALREALAANTVKFVYGILNGTCNYILTKMQDEGRPFADVLREAQQKGYAEADPTFDIGGFDAAHKLALLTSLAFGTSVAFDQVHVEGIETISAADIEAADTLGFRIKLLGVAIETASGIEARVGPTMVPKHSAIAEVSGVTNCVAIDGDFVGSLLLVGPGAGARPTASAVASDILDIARGLVLPPFLKPTANLTPYKRAKLGAHQGAYYVRLSVYDKPGAMATIAKRMGDQEVSLESIVQRRPRSALPGIDARPVPGTAAPVILITHETTEEAIRLALAAIEKDGKVSERPQMIRIEKL